MIKRVTIKIKTVRIEYHQKENEKNKCLMKIIVNLSVVTL